MTTRRIEHGRVGLALHHRREGTGPRVLGLHEGGGRGLDLPALPQGVDSWALDFTGHGESEAPAGGGLTAEILLGDVDTALREIGPATLLGFGLGAYVALLTAAAAPESVCGVVLGPGRGLEGGGPEPVALSGSPALRLASLEGRELLQAEAVSDVRPPGYARLLVRQARELGAGVVSIDPAAARHPPPWLAAVIECTGVVVEPWPEALERAARAGASIDSADDPRGALP